MRILLVKPKHIGDSLLLTPTIAAIKRDYPQAEIWVVVRRGCEGILAGCPEIARVLTVAPVERRERRLFDFWRGLNNSRRLISEKFDYVFELGDGHRGRVMARLARGPRYSVKPSSPLKQREARWFAGVSKFDWEICHRVEKDFHSVAEFLPLREPIPPLRFARERTRPWPPGDALRDFCVLQIGTRQGFNRWSRPGWRALAAALAQRFAHVVISCGPDAGERDEAAWLHRQLGAKIVDTQGALTWPQLAGLLYRARLYVGLNTAAMHLAAACGCPAVALFGRTWEGHWRPWQSPHRTVSEIDAAPLPNLREDLARATRRSMDGISPERVVVACDELIATLPPLRGPISCVKPYMKKGL